MDVSCPACAAKYTCDEDKLRGKTARMRCKSCNTAWMVSGPGATNAPPPPASMAPPSMVPVPMMNAEMPVGDTGEAKRVKTGSEREKRDLFAERESAPSSVKKDTLLPPPSFGFSTGSRNENSVLFRVDQLSDVAGRIHTPEPMFVAPAKAASEPPRSSGFSDRLMVADEEGVIDLKALASVPPPGKRSVIPVAPLFSEPPPMIVDANGLSTGNQPAVAKPVSKGKLFAAIAAAAAFLVIAGAGLSVAFKGEEPVKHAAVITPPPAPTPTQTAAPTAAPEATPAQTTASNEEAEGTKKGGKKGKKSGKKAGAGAGAQASAAPKKPADPCGCKGDFNCILACTAKNGH